jgi:SnoaL-like protein
VAHGQRLATSVERSPEVEQLAVAWLAGMKAGDAVAVAALFAASKATTVIGNGADQWFTGDADTRQRLDDSLGTHGGIPFEPGSPVGWAMGEVGWFADQVRIVFPSVTIPLRMTGVAIRPDGTWRLVQLHVSAAVSDEDLLAG